MHVVGIDRVVVATDDLDRTTGTLFDRLDLPFGDVLTLTTETDAGENKLQSAIDGAGVGIDVVQASAADADNAVSRFVSERGTGLYAVAFQVNNLNAAHNELAAAGVEPVGEITAGEFTEYLYHPHDFDGLFVFLAEFPHVFETATRMNALKDEQ